MRTWQFHDGSGACLGVAPRSAGSVMVGVATGVARSKRGDTCLASAEQAGRVHPEVQES